MRMFLLMFVTEKSLFTPHPCLTYRSVFILMHLMFFYKQYLILFCLLIILLMLWLPDCLLNVEVNMEF